MPDFFLTKTYQTIPLKPKSNLAKHLCYKIGRYKALKVLMASQHQPVKIVSYVFGVCGQVLISPFLFHFCLCFIQMVKTN
jgi:hypothetical protein